MNNKMKIKINTGCSLFSPGTRILLKSDEVHNVDNNIFWRRRIKDGSVIPVRNTKTESKFNKNKKMKTETLGKE